MKIDSSSLKDDVLKWVVESVSRTNTGTSTLTGEDLLQVDIIVSAAVQYGTYVIAHDRIETEEDLKDCTQQVVRNVLKALDVLSGKPCLLF